MKNNKVLGAILALSLTFTACGGGDGLEVDKMPTDTFEGVLELQRGNDDYLGTHLLTTEDGEVVPLRSLDLNLSKKDYLGNLVKIEGAFNTDEVFQVTDLKVISLNGEESELGRKSVYVNEELGFEIPYFSGWEIDEGGSVVSFVNEEGEEIAVMQGLFPYTPTTFEDGSVDTALEAYFYTIGENLTEDMIVYVGQEGYEAAKLEDGDDLRYILYRSGLIYEIVTAGVSDEGMRVFNEMVSGFAFTTFDLGHEEEAEAAEIELDYELNSVFESLPFAFRGAYPDDWYYSGSKAGEAGVLHRYSFSDEVVEDGNVLIVLDVLSGDVMPNGEMLKVGGNQVVISGGSVYTALGGMTFRLKGDGDYRDLMLAIAGSLVVLD